MTFYTSSSNPFGSPRRFIAYGKAGHYPLFKVGRKYFAKIVDVDAWIESHPVAVGEKHEQLSPANKVRLSMGLRLRDD